MNGFQLNDAMVLAQELAHAGRRTEAEQVYRAILAANPQSHPAYQELGLLAFGAGNLSMAADLFQTAIALNGNIAHYHRSYGEICRRMGRFDTAIEAATRACSLAPFDIDAHFNLALAFSDAKNLVAAAQAYREVLELQAPYLASSAATARMWNMRGISLHRLDRFDEARKCYERALELQPEFAEGLNCLGSLLREIGFARDARDCFSRAVDLAPEFSDARLNLGMAQLYLGEWQAGWENYEARWMGSAESRNGTLARPFCPLPQWDGQGKSDQQTLLVFAEQGFGDTFQFSRYLELAAQRFAKVGFVCPVPTMHVLMEYSFGERVLLLKQMPVDFSGWDWQCPLLSLPRAFQTRPESVPSDGPYLKVSQLARSHWGARLDRAASQRFTVGLAWAGRRTHQYDHRRSLRFEQLTPLLEDKRITWVSLQKQEADGARPVIPEGINWIDWTEELFDFADTAALVSNLDLVISIDSAMVHLAGGLGRPVWMLNRYDSEWRWLERREDSPWYPGLRIFNQPQFGDWTGAILAVQSALAAVMDGYSGA
ncbi:MAG: tetratricopeptide repeat protein [Burkholderiales bacterium]